MKNRLTREDFLDMEQNCAELACGAHTPEDRRKFEEMGRRYAEQASAIQTGRDPQTLLSEVTARFALVVGGALYVIGAGTIMLADACWNKANRSRGKPPSYLTLRARISPEIVTVAPP